MSCTLHPQIESFAVPFVVVDIVDFVDDVSVGITAQEIRLENAVSLTVGKRTRVEDIDPFLTRFSFK